MCSRRCAATNLSLQGLVQSRHVPVARWMSQFCTTCSSMGNREPSLLIVSITTCLNWVYTLHTNTFDIIVVLVEPLPMIIWNDTVPRKRENIV